MAGSSCTFKAVAVFPAGCNEMGSTLFSMAKIIHRKTYELDLLWSLLSVRAGREKADSFLQMFSAIVSFQQSQREFKCLFSAEEESAVICLPQTSFPTNSAASVIEKKKGKKKTKETNNKVWVLVGFVWFVHFIWLFVLFFCYFCG